MFLIGLVKKIIKIKKNEVIFFLVNTSVIILFFYLYFENSEILYPFILSLFIFCVYLFYECIRYLDFKKELFEYKDGPKRNENLEGELESEIFFTIDQIHEKYLRDIISKNEDVKKREIFFLKWIHNIKTSITVIDLACEKSIYDTSDSDKNNCISDILKENMKIKNNIDNCLNFLRLSDFSKDYVIASYKLKDIVVSLINYKKRDFIYNDVFPKVDIDENLYVNTDKKWCTYMLEQIIVNSIKYSKMNNAKKIEIFAQSEDGFINLYIEDKGIGIKKEDLGRVFEEFFTGYNGRLKEESTGVGLYMVKCIGDELGHKVCIKSNEEKGTLVKISFKSESSI